MKSFLNKLLEAFKDWLGRHLPDCREMTPTIGESLDRKLGPWESFMMRLHLFTCDRCGRYLEQLGFINRTLHNHDQEIVDPQSPDLSDETKDRIKRMLARKIVEAER